MQARMQDIWRSYRSLPLWVQIWVAVILVPANAAAFFLLDTWLGVAAAIAAIFVVLTNAPIMWICRGMSRLMSVPHLFAWMPLQVLIPMRLAEVVVIRFAYETTRDVKCSDEAMNALKEHYDNKAIAEIAFVVATGNFIQRIGKNLGVELEG